jgi:uncharacterized damage-inducible protein DinB
MLRSCIELCPKSRWNAKVGNWPYWLVVYHTLCFVDLYSARSNREWRPREEFHPKGRKELRDEYPSRRFTQAEMLAYCDYCVEAVRASVARETMKSLAGPTGFAWVPGTRMEHHIYNMRHVSHHMGQLSASLRRVKEKVPWVSSGTGRRGR